MLAGDAKSGIGGFLTIPLMLSFGLAIPIPIGSLQLLVGARTIGQGDNECSDGERRGRDEGCGVQVHVAAGGANRALQMADIGRAIVVVGAET